MDGILYLLIGSSASGKSTILNKISISRNDIYVPQFYTTRKRQKRDRDFYEYKFVDISEFSQLMEEKKVLFTYQCHGNYYGIPYDIIEQIKSGKSVILGCSRSLIKEFRLMFDNVRVIYLEVDLKILRTRLEERDWEDNLDERIKNAEIKSVWAEESYEIDFKLENNNNIDMTIRKLNEYLGENIKSC